MFTYVSHRLLWATSYLIVRNKLCCLSLSGGHAGWWWSVWVHDVHSYWQNLCEPSFLYLGGEGVLGYSGPFRTLTGKVLLGIWTCLLRGWWTHSTQWIPGTYLIHWGGWPGTRKVILDHGMVEWEASPLSGRVLKSTVLSSLVWYITTESRISSIEISGWRRETKCLF